MGTVWGLFGDCQGIVWGLFGNCQGIVWGLFGDCLGTVWGLFLVVSFANKRPKVSKTQREKRRGQCSVSVGNSSANKNTVGHVARVPANSLLSKTSGGGGCLPTTSPGNPKISPNNNSNKYCRELEFMMPQPQLCEYVCSS